MIEGNAMNKPTVFIGYSHKDKSWKGKLVTHLGVLQLEGLLDIWDDSRIETGEDWYPEIQEAIEAASVAILLVSADFLTSKFIRNKEVPRILERREKEGLRIFPVIMRPCAWDKVEWLARMQVRLMDGEPLSAGNDHQIETELTAIAKEVARILDKESLPQVLKEHQPDLLKTEKEISSLSTQPIKDQEKKEEILQQLGKVFLLGFETGKGRKTEINNIKVFRDEDGEIIIRYDEI